MKWIWRGLVAMSVGLVFTVAAQAQSPATATNSAAPTAAAPSSNSSVACGCEVSSGSAHRALRGRFGRLADNLGQRTDRVAEAYIGVNQRISGFFQRLAGPPVEPSVGGGFGKQKGGPYTQPGTVVFPHHPFVRSPRDFFMMEQP